MTRLPLLLILLAFAAFVTVRGQDSPAPPMLTEVQKLNVQLRLKELENAQLRLQIANDDFVRAKLEAEDALRGLQKPGWRLDLQKLAYVPEKETPE